MVQLRGAGIGRVKTGKKGCKEEAIRTGWKRKDDSECGDGE